MLPSVRSLLAGVLLLVTGIGAYFVARESSLFAIRTIEVRGARPALQARVRQALAPLTGVNLLRLDGNEVRRLVATVSGVSAASYDRDFPHTLKLFVRPERPVAVLRQGARSFLVSAHGRLVGELPRSAAPRLPRIWLPATVELSAGETLADATAARAVAVASGLSHTPLPARVRFVRADPTGLAIVLRSGLQIELGDTGSLQLKLAVARAVLLSLARSGTLADYVDVRVPERPVAAGNTQVGG